MPAKETGLAFKNVKITGEADSVDQEAAELPDVRKIIEEKGYLPEQVFYADKSNLFWKQKATKDTY